MKRILISIFIIVSACHLNAQQPPCMPDYYGLTYSVPRLQEFPPLSIYMPYDVMIGYIALDTLCKNSSKSELEDFLNRQTYNDTIKYIMRCLYNVVDYDPILFRNSLYYWNDSLHLPPKHIYRMILKSIVELSPDKFLHSALLSSSYILYVHVIDTLRRVTPSAANMKTVAIATCEVIDTIKGKVLPQCKDINIYLPITKEKNENQLTDFPSNCIQFEYRLEWPRGYTGSDVIKSIYRLVVYGIHEVQRLYRKRCNKKHS